MKFSLNYQPLFRNGAHTPLTRLQRVAEIMPTAVYEIGFWNNLGKEQPTSL